MKKLLLLCAVVSITTHTYAQDIFKAIIKNDAAKVEKLIAKGVDLNMLGLSPDGDSIGVIEMAAGYSHMECIRVLAKYVDQIDDSEAQMSEALVRAAGQSLEDVKLCLSLGADINHHCGGCYGRTALLVSYYTEHPEIAEYLLEQGADFMALDAHGRSILFPLAASNMLSEFNKYEDKFDVLALDSSGIDVFYMALIQGSKDVYIDLWKHNAGNLNINRQDTSGTTALMYCTESEEYLDEIVWLTEELDADVHLQDDDGYDALFGAVYQDVTCNAKALLRAGAKTHKSYFDQEMDMETCLMDQALMNKNPKMVEVLLAFNWQHTQFDMNHYLWLVKFWNKGDVEEEMYTMMFDYMEKTGTLDELTEKWLKKDPR